MEINEGTILKINLNEMIDKDNFTGMYVNAHGLIPYALNNKNEIESKGNRPVMFIETNNNSYYFCRFQGVNKKYNQNNEIPKDYLKNGKFYIFNKGDCNGFFTKDSMLCLDLIIEVDKKEFDKFIDKHILTVTTTNINTKFYETIKKDVDELLINNLPNIPIIKVDVNKLFKKPIIKNGKYYNQIGETINGNTNVFRIEKINTSKKPENKTHFSNHNFLRRKFKKWKITPQLERILNDFGIKPSQKVLDFSNKSNNYEIFISDENKLRMINNKIEKINNQHNNTITKLEQEKEKLTKNFYSQINNTNKNNQNKKYNQNNYHNNKTKYIDADNDNVFSIFKRKNKNERER